MKNIILICFLSTVILTSCKDRKTTGTTEEQISNELINEVRRLEQENQELDQIHDEIQNSSKELDVLLEELND